MKKQVLVTGANKGIGYEIARHLGKSGWQVVVGARCEDRALKAMEALRTDGADVAGWQYVNLADNGEIEVSAREIAEKYPGLSLLVNNAGIPGDKPSPKQIQEQDYREAPFQSVCGIYLNGCSRLSNPARRSAAAFSYNDRRRESLRVSKAARCSLSDAAAKQATALLFSRRIRRSCSKDCAIRVRRKSRSNSFSG